MQIADGCRRVLDAELEEGERRPWHWVTDEAVGDVCEEIVDRLEEVWRQGGRLEGEIEAGLRALTKGRLSIRDDSFDDAFFECETDFRRSAAMIVALYLNATEEAWFQFAERLGWK